MTRKWDWDDVTACVTCIALGVCICLTFNLTSGCQTAVVVPAKQDILLAQDVPGVKVWIMVGGKRELYTTTLRNGQLVTTPTEPPPPAPTTQPQGVLP